MPCPFCSKDITESALVCAACGRDIAIPESLIAERSELLTKLDDLKSELARANARLAARRGHKPRAEPV
jgi:hypothetical protein